MLEWVREGIGNRPLDKRQKQNIGFDIINIHGLRGLSPFSGCSKQLVDFLMVC